MDFDFKKPMYMLAALAGLYWYVSTHYTAADVLTWARQRPVVADRNKYVYYVGMYYYAKDMPNEATEAFRELLTEEATCQYEPKALMRMGRSYQDMRRFDEARAAYERYIEAFPTGPDIEAVKNNYEFVKFK